ncbi:SSI family serine proteinase inhibitor [Streptomyces sp. NPDC001262]|uniref:SSI family serine proteinase inhibitor n=1 Tax=Streptomyces sp. NPDC001262 TaxID=3364552 RepID=UPI0036929175
MPLHRLALAAAALAAPALLAAGAAAGAAPIPLPEQRTADHLVVTITHSGDLEGTFHLYCHPLTGSTHPRAADACKQLDGGTTWGKDPFAPVPKDQICPMIYGGPQQAHVTGRWAGRPVDAHFNRTNGCETARWDKFSILFGEPKARAMT